MRGFLFYIFIGLFGLNILAQNNNPMRIEVSSHDFEEVYGLPLDNELFIIVKHHNRNSSKGEDWVLEVYNSSLEKKNNTSLFLPRYFVPVEYRLQGDSVIYMCFAEPSGKRGSFMLYRYNFDTGLIWSKYVKGSRKSVFINFEVEGDKIIILGENINDILPQFAESKMPYGIKIVSPVLPKYSEVIASISSDDNNEAVVIVEIDRGNQKGLYYYQFDNNKEEIIKSKLNKSSDVNIVDGSLVESDDGSLLLMGTFNYNEGKDVSRERAVANGTFIGKLENASFSFFKTNKYIDYKNIYGTLSAQQQKQLRQRANKGKEISVAFKMLTHKKAFKQAGLYVMAAETYYPEYHYENNFDSRGYMYQQQVFDGYRTTNCVVSAYNADGNMVWDNYMHSSEIIELSLQENILVFTDEDSNIVMAYYYDGSVYSKTVNGNDIVYKKAEDKIETILNETIISEQYGRIEHWYGEYFLLSGHQTIFGLNGKKRKVYFFNLISFD